MRVLASVRKKLLLQTSPRVARLLGVDFFQDLVPEYLWLEATNQCGSRCMFCNIWRGEPAKDLLSAREVGQTLEDPLFSRLKIVVISGGEPTLRDDLVQLLTSVHAAVPKAAFVLTSNAMQPDRLLRSVNAALALGVRLDVCVSLDALDTEHDRIRGTPGLFCKVDYALRELSKLERVRGKKLRVVLSYVLSDATVSQLDALTAYARELGVRFNLQWYHQNAYYKNQGRDLLSHKDELLRAARVLRPTLLHVRGMQELQGGAPKLSCTSMFNFCLIRCSGDLVPCFGMWDSKLGNVRERTPSAIWASEAARQARRRVRACQGCLNSCGVAWSYDADYVGRLAFYLRHPDAFLSQLGWLRG